MRSNYPSLYTPFFSHSLFYAYFLTKDFSLFGFFLLSLPFNFKDQFAQHPALGRRSEKEYITKPFVLSSIFCFFLFYFFSLNVIERYKHIKASP